MFCSKTRLGAAIIAVCVFWVGSAVTALEPAYDSSQGASALEAPHDSSNGIDCLDCHAIHGGGPLLPRDVAQEGLCRSCHNPLGMAGTYTKFALHEVEDATITIDCGSCHNPHSWSETTDPHSGSVADNLNLVRDDIEKYWPTAATPAIFQTRPGHFAFADPPLVGICQNCHTATDYYRNDGTVDNAHNQGAMCTTCHTHEEGFMPVGGCLDCHNTEKGSRRQIVEFEGDGGGDFVRTSHHVQGTPEESDCVVCHYMGSHASGTVKLKDPDAGSALVYDYDSSNPAGIEDFCLNCHDSNGAGAQDTPAQPFSDGQAPPDIKRSSIWGNSAHASFDYAVNADQPITCMGDGSGSGCHGNGHGSDAEKLLNASGGSSIAETCFACHTEGGVVNDALSNRRTGGYTGADDIEQAFASSRHHNLGDTFSVGGNDFTLECTTCHNPHVVTGQYWDAESGLTPVTRPDFSDPAENPRAMGATLWGDDPLEKMDAFAGLASGSGGWYFSTARGGQIGFDQAAQYRPPKDGAGYDSEFSGDVLPDYTTLCLDCHSYRMSAGIPPVNWGQGIACTGNSVDPPDQRVECGAAHGFGSANRPGYISDSGTAGFWGSSGNPDVLFDMNYVTRGRGNGHFMRWPYETADRAAGVNFVMSCTDCHEAHGSNRGGMIRERFNVNANGDCGTGGDTAPNGENCSDGGNWNAFCGACHYYYGGQHAGMSCGNASCHEANSIHRIVKEGGGGSTVLQLTASGQQADYVPPDFTPDNMTVEGIVGHPDLLVVFPAAVYANADLSGDLQPDDFWLFDKNGDNPRTIVAVTHTAGDPTAVLTMSAPLAFNDMSTDTLAQRKASVWLDWSGTYNNAATGTHGPEVVSGGPWPVTISPSSACPPDPVTFEFAETAGSSVTLDASGMIWGDVNNPAGTATNPVASMQGNGSLHLMSPTAIGQYADADKNYVAFDGNLTCLKDPNAVTIDVLFKTGDVDRDYEATAPLWEDQHTATSAWPDTGTWQHLFNRKRSLQIAVMRADYGGDNVPSRSERAKIEVKYRVPAAYRHSCPWPDYFPNEPLVLPDGCTPGVDCTDPYSGNSAWMHQVSTDHDSYPILGYHWYRMRVVFNAGKTNLPVDIWLDDKGTDGNDTGQYWSGFINATRPDREDSSPCRWGSLPGDRMATEDQAFYIGSSWNANEIYLFEGEVARLTWRTGADYVTEIDEGPNYTGSANNDLAYPYP